jgi:hypothetical protein
VTSIDTTNERGAEPAEMAAIRQHLDALIGVIQEVDDFITRDQLCVHAQEALKEGMERVLDERAASMRRQTARGWTRAMIAETLGLTASRVQQIIRR